jgi:hypothetical protein
VGWLTRWPELRDVVGTCIGSVTFLVELILWAVAGREPDPLLTGGALTLLGVTGGLALLRITSTGSRSSSPPLPSPPPSSSSPVQPGGTHEPQA